MPKERIIADSHKAKREDKKQKIKLVLWAVIAVIIIGTGLFVWHATNTANKLNDSVAKNTTDMTAKQQANAAPDIVAAVVAHNPDIKAPIVPIKHQDYTTAFGTIADGQQGTPVKWLAEKKDGTWQITAQGADICEALTAANFQKWDPDCTASSVTDKE